MPAPPIGTAFRSAGIRMPNASILLFCVTVATVGTFFLFHIVSSPEELTSRFSVDDSFYYFQTAWQTALSGFVTFDGIHQANGVHFLWFVLLYAFALLSPDKIFLLYAGYLVALALALLVYGLIWRAGTLLDDRRRHLTLVIALLWTVILAGKSNQLFVGMESTLHMATLWACFVTFLKFTRKLEDGSDIPNIDFLLLSVCLVMISWARLDSALYSLIFYLGALFLTMRKNKIHAVLFSKCFWLSLIVIAVGAAIQIGFYMQSAGTVIPISGLIKAASPHATSVEMLRSFVSILFPFGNIAALHAEWFLVTGTLLFLLLLFYVIWQARRAATPIHWAFHFASLLGVGTILFAALSCSHHDAFSRWYLAPVYMFYILGCGCFLHRSLYGTGVPSGRNGLFHSIVVLALYLLGISGLIESYARTPLYLTRYQLSQFLRDHTKPNDVLASFNAGQLAYFSDRKLINLDGLVNDKRYHDEILNKPSKILSYLRDNDVTYVVDYDFYWAESEIINNTELVYSIPSRALEGFIFTIRRIKPG